jgi:FMN phosphatase YigB (HAD superfamily)
MLAAIQNLDAHMCSHDVVGVWMVGDDPDTEIPGAARLGMITARTTDDRTWPADLPVPAVIPDSFVNAITQNL